MRVASGWIKPTWRAVGGLICAASLAVNLVLLWPRLTLLSSALTSQLPSIASCLSLLLGYLTRPDLLSLLVARSHLYALLNLILMRILYRSGILSRPPTSPAAPAFPLCNTSYIPKKQHLSAVPLSHHDHDALRQAEDHALISHDYHSKTRHYASSCVDNHAPEVHHQLLRMKDNRSKQQFGSPHNEAADAATVAPQQIKNILTIKKEKIRKKGPSLFSIEPLSNTMCDGDQLHAQPQPDKQMTRSYTVNYTAPSSPFSASASAGPSFQRSSSEARRSNYSYANYSVHGTHRDNPETKRSSLIHSADPYCDLSKEEFNETVETFISKFRKKLSMQRQDSFNRLLGLVNGIQ